MATTVLNKMRQICLSLPDTEETPTWGQPHFRVCGKIFAGCSEEKGGAHRMSVTKAGCRWTRPA